MDLEFDEEQSIMRKAVRAFLNKECLSDLVRAMRDDERGFPEELWASMAELGWMGVIIPEEYGGSEGSFMDLAIILEAMGEVCTPGPFFSTVVLGAQALLLSGSEVQKQSLLPRIAAGEIVLALAQIEPGNRYGTSNIKTWASKGTESYRISGTKLFVENAHIADYILCVARTQKGTDQDQGLTLFLVDGASPGIKCTPLKTLGYDKQCEVVFDDVSVSKENVLGEVGRAAEVLKVLEQRAAVAKCAEMIGAIEKVLEMVVAYAQEREQFGHLIGSFQAVQHHCANMAIDVDSSRFITYQAAWRISKGLPATKEAAMAKAWTGDASNRVTRLGHQVHGAISFCEEHDMHLYYRKVKAASIAFGDSEYHLERLAQEFGL